MATSTFLSPDLRVLLPSPATPKIEGTDVDGQSKISKKSITDAISDLNDRSNLKLGRDLFVGKGNEWLMWNI